MGNLIGTMGAATRTLSSFTEALSVIQNNIGNAATPNYARQRVSLAPLGTPDGASQSLGVEVNRIQSLRDRLLDFQVLPAKQSTSLFEKKALTLQQVEPLFRLSGNGSLGANLDEFFASISALSVSPGDVNLRRSVLSAADQLTRTFRSTVSGLSQSLSNLDTDARSTVGHINSLLEQVAELSSRRTNHRCQIAELRRRNPAPSNAGRAGGADRLHRHRTIRRYAFSSRRRRHAVGRGADVDAPHLQPRFDRHQDSRLARGRYYGFSRVARRGFGGHSRSPKPNAPALPLAG